MQNSLQRKADYGQTLETKQGHTELFTFFTQTMNKVQRHEDSQRHEVTSRCC